MKCCCCSVTKLCPILCNPMDCSTAGFPVFHISWSLLKLMSIESMMPFNYLTLCRLLLLPLIFPSFRIFSNELALHIRQPKYQSFSFSISPSNEYSGLISFRIDCFDLLAVHLEVAQLFNKIPSFNLIQHNPRNSSYPNLEKLFQIDITQV